MSVARQKTIATPVEGAVRFCPCCAYRRRRGDAARPRERVREHQREYGADEYQARRQPDRVRPKLGRRSRRALDRASCGVGPMTEEHSIDARTLFDAEEA